MSGREKRRAEDGDDDEPKQRHAKNKSKRIRFDDNVQTRAIPRNGVVSGSCDSF